MSTQIHEPWQGCHMRHQRMREHEFISMRQVDWVTDILHLNVRRQSVWVQTSSDAWFQHLTVTIGRAKNAACVTQRRKKLLFYWPGSGYRPGGRQPWWSRINLPSLCRKWVQSGQMVPLPGSPVSWMFWQEACGDWPGGVNDRKGTMVTTPLLH